MSTFQIPFDPFNGNMQHYPNEWPRYTKDENGKSIFIPVDWREPVPFSDTLKLVNYMRGRSAAYFEWKSTTNGAEYPMFLTDIFDLATSVGIGQDGLVTGTFGYKKRGQNYGIRLISGKQEDAE